MTKPKLGDLAIAMHCSCNCIGRITDECTRRGSNIYTFMHGEHREDETKILWRGPEKIKIRGKYR